MASLNRVQLIGNLGGEVEKRATGEGRVVANFSLATTESFTGKDGKRDERTEWHRVVVWEGLAETCAKYLQKGSSVFVEGRIEQAEWLDKEGQRHVKFEIIARDVQFLSRPKGKGDGANLGLMPEAAPVPAELEAR